MEKHELRQRIWDELDASGVIRSPIPPNGHIPNFVGAENAAERLAACAPFTRASTVLVTPDRPQEPVLEAALSAGKSVFTVVKGLTEADCFIHLDPDRIDSPGQVTTYDEALSSGLRFPPAELPPIDLAVFGSVAVTAAGSRVGKGNGYSDLEYALLREYDLADWETVVATTIHETQLVDETVASSSYDVPMDLAVTPERMIQFEQRPKPDGIDWKQLSEEEITAIPVLQNLE